MFPVTSDFRGAKILDVQEQNRINHVMKISKSYSNGKIPHIIKAAFAMYLILLIFIAPYVIFFLWAMIFLDRSFWVPFVTLFAIFLAMLVWTRRFKIVILGDKIVYSTLFSKKNVVKFANIKKLEIKIGQNKNVFYALHIHDNNRYSTEPLIINMKPFSKNDLSLLVKTITSVNPSVEIDHDVKKLKQGHFEPAVYRILNKLRNQKSRVP